MTFSLRRLPLGMAYAVRTDIGADGTLIAGIVLLGESSGFWRAASALLIVGGIIGLYDARTALKDTLKQVLCSRA